MGRMIRTAGGDLNPRLNILRAHGYERSHAMDNLPDEETLDPAGIRELQTRKLAAMLYVVRATNPFYKLKLAGHSFDPATGSLDDLPFTTRAELEADQAAHPPYGSNLTYGMERYCRYHQTSGSGGRPMRWLDTAESWQWFKNLWAVIFRAAGVTRSDRILFPFSFGPFVGFWAAFDGAAELCAMCLPAGGLSTQARLRMMIDNDATVVCCTPTYALRMAEVAAQEGIDLPASKVATLIVAGEPGGSISEVRARIESAWGARVFDHTGMTEIGALSFECAENRGTGVHIIDSEFIAETIDPKTLQAAAEGQVGELVLTNLGRWGSPLVRYRTGDHVRMTRGRCACGRWFARLEGGILGRVDDMFIVRGNNVFPTAVEAVLRGLPEVAEFRCTIRNDAALTQVTLEIEPTRQVTDPAALVGKVASSMQGALSFRPDVVAVPVGSLPRFELKAKRFVRDAGEPRGLG
jgi:phenylacetate-CoA ligase